MVSHRASSLFSQSAPGSLASFTEEILGYLPRADQRRWAHAYVNGLLSTPGKKTVRRLAASVSSSPTACQSLYQLINVSPWDWRPARRNLTQWVLRRATPRAWTVGLAVLPKRGDRSVGVHRRFDPASGRTLNCQIGVGIFMDTDAGPTPLGWRLLLPDDWADDHVLRARARIPECNIGHFPLSAQVLDLVRTVHRKVTANPLPVVADLTGCPEVSSLLHGLSRCGADFAVAVPPTLPVLPGGPLHAQGPGPAAGIRAGAPLPVKRLLGLGESGGTAAGAAGRPRQPPLHSAPVRLPDAKGAQATAAPPRTYRAFLERVPAGCPEEPVWVTNMVHERAQALLALTGLHHRASATVRTLQEEFGLRDFEGRSYPGWHHHMTLVSAAYGYSLLAARARGRGREPYAHSGMARPEPA
ncbi:IS701 family transposase [Streptomyces sp. NPDC001339]|uniref:IS701 family transposase n=1 Tax=Streptomyces sp. NPDC001339 TaxID=3364563 RepID=UPI0036A49B18